MAEGDHIKSGRVGYQHHGIEVGRGEVIHLSRAGGGIERISKLMFADGNQTKVVGYAESYPNVDVVRRAESRLGEKGYDLFFSNCEHFARWCKTGESKSEQVKDKTSAGVGTLAGAGAIRGGIAVVSGAGTVAGLSGAGVMSGLATTGAVVGGGAVAGIGVIAAAPAIAAVTMMGSILEDDEKLDGDERDARKAGRAASYVGAVGGAAGTVAAISAGGTTAGLSAAGITSGLAAIGAGAGGGMVAGVAVTVAAPAVAAAAVGYGIYKTWQWLAD